MERIRQKHTRKKRAVDLEALKLLIEESGVPKNRIEKDLGMGKGIIGRAMIPEAKHKLPPKWELPIIKYLKKKIAEKKDVEVQTTEVLQELGFKTPEQESDLKEELKEVKRAWIEGLQG